MYNPAFKVVEFDHFKMQAGLPSFVLSPGQWIKKTSAMGIFVGIPGTSYLTWPGLVYDASGITTGQVTGQVQRLLRVFKK